MIFNIQKIVKSTVLVLLFLFLTGSKAWAGGPPEPSIFSNTLAVMLIVIMILLLIVIGILGNVLIGSAQLKLKNKKKEKASGYPSILLIATLFPASGVFGQDTPAVTPAASSTIGGITASTFYLMVTVIFLELILIIAMLINIRFLLQKEKESTSADEEVAIARKAKINWWDKLNKLKPVSQEAELDLGHEYDGIRELNNKLPPWWLYGFYLSIVFAVVYLWRFHVSHTAPSSEQEYQMAVAKADIKIKEYLKAKGDAVDENSVVMLNTPDDLDEGKLIYMKSCASCHTETGAGNVGPNLTDDFWLHGNDIKSVFKTIRYGINAMPQWQNTYSNKQMAQVASYIKTLHGTNPPNAKAPQGIEMKEAAPAIDSAGQKSTDTKTVKQ